MATTLTVLRQELSKELGDYWASSLTSIGAADGTTIIDTVLTDKDNDWVASPAGEDEPTCLLTSLTYTGQERPIASKATSTLTVKRAYGGQVASGTTYELHRLFTAEEKQNALIYAAKSVFPGLFKKVLDNTFTTGNWVRNGDFEDWTVATYPDYWRAVTITAAANTNAYYIARGSKGCQLSGTPG